jgi:hypothetical protein
MRTNIEVDAERTVPEVSFRSGREYRTFVPNTWPTQGGNGSDGYRVPARSADVGQPGVP